MDDINELMRRVQSNLTVGMKVSEIGAPVIESRGLTFDLVAQLELESWTGEDLEPGADDTWEEHEETQSEYETRLMSEALDAHHGWAESDSDGEG
jgi:hypothetical protein